MSDASRDAWPQLTIIAGRYEPEQLEEALFAAGALSVTFQDAGDQPVLEPAPGATPLWSQTRVTGLFDPATDLQQVHQVLTESLGDTYLADCQVEPLANRDWLRACLEGWQPLCFGRRLWVCPTAQPPPPSANVVVRLDPGLAFGTGTHPSTALCLSWLDAADLTGKTVLDYGCGSGILAIAAAKLGAAQVWAVDIDPQALLATAENAATNAVADRLVIQPPAALAAPPVDILLANILAGPLVQLAPSLATRVRPGGQVVLAGLLARQADAVMLAYQQVGFVFGPPQRRDDWQLLQARRYTA